MNEISILLLEDQQTDADLITHYLMKENLAGQILHVMGKEGFLTALEKSIPDLILCDYHLPGFNALNVLAMLDEQELDIPLIVLTGQVREEDAIECMRLGAKDYILKDRLARLPEAIRNALENRAILEKQQQVESSLKESEERFQQLYETVPVALYRSTYEGKLVSCNQAFLELLGYEDEKMLIDQDVQKLLYLNPQDREIWRSRLSHNDTLIGQFRARRADGEALWLEDFAHVIRDEQGEIIYYEGYLLDITQTQRLALEQDAIASINAVLRLVDDIGEIVDVIAEHVLRVSDATGLGITLLSKPDTMEINYLGGVWSDWNSEKMLIEGGACHKVISSLEPYVENNWPDKKVENWELFSDMTSLAGIPLHFQGQPLGIIWVGRDQPFQNELIQLLMLIADIVSVELNRKSLSLANQRALHESQALEEISRTLNQTLGMEQIFKLIVEFLVAITEDTNRAIIHLYDEVEDHMFTVAYARKDSDSSSFEFPSVKVLADGRFDFQGLAKDRLAASRMRSRQGIAGIAIADGKLINVYDTELDDRFVQTDKPTDIRSLLAVPIMSGDSSIGAISLIADMPNVFDKDDEMLVERFGLQVTIAIGNARLYEAERVQREIAQAQAKIAAALNQTLELDTVLQLILEQLERVIPYDGANILLIDGNEISIGGQRGYEAQGGLASFIERAEGITFDTPSHQKIIQTQQPLIIANVRESDDWVEYSEEESGIGSYAGIPLIIEDRTIGLLNLDSNIEFFFTPEMIENIRSFSNDAALAIWNAKLYSDLEKALENEQATRVKLIRTDKLAGMGRMVASVAHELNNPLQTIKNCLFLMEQASLSEDNELLDLAMSEIERLTGIVNRLREVYRPMQGTELEDIPLDFLMEEVRLLLIMHLKRHKVTWQYQAEKSFNYYIKGIPGQLKQVFINLGLNAVEAMQADGGILYVELLESVDGKEIGVVFRDTGPGIPEDQLKYIFDPFYTTKSTGMGLGLSICYDIAQNHNSRIVVENSDDGGAEFIVWFPLAYTEEKAAPPPGV